MIVYCKVCGGMLKPDNGLYVCTNCGNKQQITAYFENTEVFIAYIENDLQGRRTKDSVIAQDIYKRLQASNINTFYQRISAPDLTAADYEKAHAEAITRAKIILILGTSKHNFEQLIETNDFQTKVIIPIYSGMNAYELPAQLSNLQAMRYDDIGTFFDLSKNILHILGRETEINVGSFYNAESKKRKRLLYTLFCITLLIIISITSYFVFFTPYVLKSKKYDFARELAASGEYTKAIEIYSNLSDYKDSSNMMFKLYSKYNGYFNGEDNSLRLGLNIDSNLVAKITIIKTSNGATVKTETSAVVTGNIISFDFKDSNENHGKGEIILKNYGIMLNTSSDADNNLSYSFTFDTKSDAPLALSITKDEILSWLKNKTTEKDLTDKGYKLEVIPQYNPQKGGDSYISIKDTDITMTTVPYDIPTLSSQGNYTDEDGIVVAVYAPAEIVISEKVGYASAAFIDDDVAYIPSAAAVISLYDIFYVVPGDAEYTNNKIEKNTSVLLVSRNCVGDKIWADIQKFVHSY